MHQQRTFFGCVDLLLTGAVLVGCMGPVAPPPATEADALRGPAEARIADTHAHLFHSARTREVFLVHVALPQVPAQAPLPVVYVVDGNTLFALVTETARLLMQSGELPPLLVVGIGYDATDPQRIAALRTRDLTPTPAHDLYARRDGHGSASLGSGGAQRFLGFIQHELQPFIESRYPVDPHDATLAGHGFGGLFALYALIESPPESFRRYVAGSPALWWDDERTVRRLIERARTLRDRNARLFLSVGGLEEDGTNPASHRAAMVTNVERVTRALRADGGPGVALETVIFHNETHLSSVPGTLSRGLRSVFADSRPSAHVADDGKTAPATTLTWRSSVTAESPSGD